MFPLMKIYIYLLFSKMEFYTNNIRFFLKLDNSYIVLLY